MAKEKHAVHCPRKKHVDTVVSFEKSNVSAVVVAHKRDQNNRRLLALEIINSC
jgi:hypothetical protein